VRWKTFNIFLQIYSGNGIPNFIGIAQVLWELLQKHFGLFFLDTVYYIESVQSLQFNCIADSLRFANICMYSMCCYWKLNYDPVSLSDTVCLPLPLLSEARGFYAEL